MPIFLGIDGGATRTRAAIASEDRVLGIGSSAGSNPTRASAEFVRASLHKAIECACSSAGITAAQIDFACVGAAGSSRPEAGEQLRCTISEIVPAPMEIVGDMLIAHASAFFGMPGIVVSAGTGSIAWGCNQRGETARAGGWGCAVSDEGSGYWVGRSAITAAIRARDEGQSTTLGARIARAWHVESLDDVIRIAGGNPPPNYSTLFPEVQAAAESGDLVARGVLTAAGTELAQLARILVQQLWPEEGPVDIAMAGGVFLHSAEIRSVFYELIHAARAQVRVRLSNIAPVFGALYLARAMARATSISADANGDVR